jgi:hypothetical protein
MANERGEGFFDVQVNAAGISRKGAAAGFLWGFSRRTRRSSGMANEHEEGFFAVG